MPNRLNIERSLPSPALAGAFKTQFLRASSLRFLSFLVRLISSSPAGGGAALFRKIAEMLVRNRAIKRKLPNGSKIFLSPDSQLKYLKASFDRDLLDLAEQHSSATAVIWDIGANCGTLSFAPRSAKQIIAVEADPFLVSVLQKSAGLSTLPVTIIPAAVYSEIGLAEFAIAKRGRASNYLVAAGGRSQSGGIRSRIIVPTITLDLLLDRFGPPTLVKIDVEGAEAEVLSGGSRLLQHARPTIYFEAGRQTYQKCEDVLLRAGYHIEKSTEMNWTATPTHR